MRKLVDVSRAPITGGDSDGFFEPLTPPQWWAEIDPLDPTASDGSRILSYRVSGRFHPMISIDSRLTYHDSDLEQTRELFVKGVQALNRHRLVLYCEEVV